MQKYDAPTVVIRCTVSLDGSGVIEQCAETYYLGDCESASQTVEIFTSAGTQTFADAASALMLYQFMRLDPSRLAVSSVQSSSPLRLSQFSDWQWYGSHL